MLGIITLLAAAYLSERINSRVIATVILQFWALPLLIALYTFDRNTSQWVYFAVVTLINGYPYVHPIQGAIYPPLSSETALSVFCYSLLGITKLTQCQN